MRNVPMPSTPVPQAVFWLSAGALASVALFSPGPLAVAFLLAAAVATCVGYLVRCRRMTRQLVKDKEMLARSLGSLERLENLAGFGRWCIELWPRRHLWSDEMCYILGFPAGTEPRDDILSRVLPQGLEQIDLALAEHADDRDPFVLEFEFVGRGNEVRVLRARARNIYAASGKREEVFMVVNDVTDRYALQRDRDDALALAAEARREANTDPLTGLCNRRFAMTELDRVLSGGVEGNLSLIVFDIDHFKRVNDRHGHPVGDKLIALVAQIAGKQVRLGDTIARIGGEEFLVIMPNCTASSAIEIAERLRWAIEAGTHSAPVPCATVSVGHAQYAPHDTSLTLFARADAALYKAKRRGRNRIAEAA